MSKTLSASYFYLSKSHNTVNGYWLNSQVLSEEGIFLFVNTSRLPLVPTELPIQLISATLLSDVKQPNMISTNLNLVPKLRTHGAIRPFSHTSSGHGGKTQEQFYLSCQQ
jgi:hypothetical protein